MKSQDITNHIKHYLDKDLCNGAIMLTGSWGTGKSFFVQKELIPELHDNNKKCIVVSLYGLANTGEISKNIYFELKAKQFLEGKVWFKKKIGWLFKIGDTIKNFFFKVTHNIASTTEIYVTGKTLLNGITNRFGIDLSFKDNDLEKIYKSINLKDTLIILEDIERSEISIVELLGYVNSLVEQDSVKVLIIANESEFLHYTEKETGESNLITEKTQKKKISTPDSETMHYLRIKEKTINDTIIFEGDYFKAIREIIQKYEHHLLSRKFGSSETHKEIYSIMKMCACFNLRSFMYACQKTVDIFDKLPCFYQEKDDFLKSIFYGNLFYILRIKDGKDLKWGVEKYFSEELGCREMPLFKFCYDYINTQFFNAAIVNDTFRKFEEYKKYDGSKSDYDENLSILANYYRSEDEEVHTAVARITDNLEKKDALSFYVYGKIAVYLIYVKYNLGCNIDKAKTLLVRNLKGEGNHLEPEQIFRIVLGNDATKEMRCEYEELKKDMVAALKTGLSLIPNFEYLPTQVDIFCNYVHEHEGKFHIDEGFARDLDMYKFKEMFSKCSNSQKDDLRYAFCSMYNYPSIGQLLKDDLDNVILLKNLLAKELRKSKAKTIEKLQYEWFVMDLGDIIENCYVLRKRI